MEDESDELAILKNDEEVEAREIMGLFDLPAFARRGQELEQVLHLLNERCRKQREERLDMVRVRLKQWARVAAGAHDWDSVFAGPIEILWTLSGAEPPVWAEEPAAHHRRLAVARDLHVTVVRFNRRWHEFVHGLDLSVANVVIDHYNRYYVLEKECVVGSGRLAAQFFTPVSPLTPMKILQDHPLLPEPELIDGRPGP